MSFTRKFQEQPLKNSQKVNKMHIPNSSYLKSFKKNTSTNNRQNIRVKTQVSQHSMTSEASSRNNLKPVSAIKNHKFLRNPDGGDQYQQIHYLMQETDNSMQELLNSSINQFQKLIIKEDEEQSLEEQNYRLRNALAKMKHILKQKLESALQKQKDELSRMLQDYISLITKLLQDKEELTTTLQNMQEQKKQQINKLEHNWHKKLKSVMEDNDEQMHTTKNQIQQFLKVIEQYEEEAQNQEGKFLELNEKILKLEEENALLRNQLENGQQSFPEDQSLRIEAQSTKIQTLLQLLEKSQKQKNQMMEEISFYKNSSKKPQKDESVQLQDLRDRYEKRIQELEDEHEEEFLEYEKAIKDTISKKDQCIERLNLIIENLRERERKNAQSNHR